MADRAKKRFAWIESKSFNVKVWIIVVFSLISFIFIGRGQCEVSVVIAGFIGGRDRAVEERRGGAVRPGGHSIQPCFSRSFFTLPETFKVHEGDSNACVQLWDKAENVLLE